MSEVMQMLMIMPMLKKLLAPTRRRRRQSSYSETPKKRCAKGYKKKCSCVKTSGSQSTGKKKSTRKSQNLKNPGSAFLALNAELGQTQDSLRALTQSTGSSGTPLYTDPFTMDTQVICY